MPTDPKPRGTLQLAPFPAKIPPINVANADPTVQRALQAQAETINRILDVLNANFKNTPIGVALK